jgi:hypothetical protein
VFRADHSGYVLRTNADGELQASEGPVEVLADEGRRLTLRMKLLDGSIDYTFRFQPNATLVLTAGEGELVFTRAK